MSSDVICTILLYGTFKKTEEILNCWHFVNWCVRTTIFSQNQWSGHDYWRLNVGISRLDDLMIPDKMSVFSSLREEISILSCLTYLNCGQIYRYHIRTTMKTQITNQHVQSKLIVVARHNWTFPTLPSMILMQRNLMVSTKWSLQGEGGDSMMLDVCKWCMFVDWTQ